MALLTLILLLLFPVFSVATPNFKCKNASSDWPLPCTPPFEGYKLRFDGFPITAWWGPAGYSTSTGEGSDKQLRAYAKANFSVALLGDRTPDHATFDASWSFILENIANAEALGLQVLLDTYAPLLRPWNGAIGGEAQGGTNRYVDKKALGGNHKITLPEVQWLAAEVQNRSSVVGILITDDGVDLAANEIEEIQWMKEHTPELWPWVNQCGDGAAWLARAGTPYEAYELYSIKGPGGDAVKMAQGQLGGYDTTRDRSNRFGLQPFPLFNVGDGGDTGLVRSPSLVRFEAYAALAYGSKGLMWYCWGRGLWDLEAEAPTSIYPTAREVNSNVRAWGAELLRFDEHEGVFHTGWEGPSASSLAPSPAALVASMSDDLLAGVMTSPTLPNAALVVVVDKRVDSSADEGEARQIAISFSADVSSASFLPGATGESVSGGAADAGPSVELTLATGGAAVVLLAGDGLRAAIVARRMRPWRFSADGASLASVWTNQHSFYDFGYEQRPQTKMVLALDAAGEGGPSSEKEVAALAKAGFNLVVLDDDNEQLDMALNAGLRNGLAVARAAPADADAFARTLRRVGCHPNFGGYLILPQSQEDAGDVGRVTSATAFMRREASHLLPLTAVDDIDALRAVVGASGRAAQFREGGTPAPVLLPLGEDGATVNAAVAGYAQLLRASQSDASFTPIAGVRWCADAPEGERRLRLNAALALGARGVLVSARGCAGGAAPPVGPVGGAGFGGAGAVLALGRAVRWGDALLGMRVRALFATGGTVPIPAGQGARLPGSNELVESMDADLLVAVLHSAKDGTDTTPPSLLVVNLRFASAEDSEEDEAPRSVAVRLEPDVYGWTPLEGDAEAGFASCSKLVLGRELRLDLPAGGAELMHLTMGR